MSSYLKSAINELYSEGDDFVLLGLTGRTGSGCSTVASILKSEKRDIKHSLFNGDNPESNEDRKQKIIDRCFSNLWEPFTLLQVRSLITVIIAQHDIPQNFKENIQDYNADGKNLKKIEFILKKIKDVFLSIKNDTSDEKELTKERALEIVKFFSDGLPRDCEEIRKILGESHFIKLYQFVGKNIRTSGHPYKMEQEEKKSFTLANEINDSIKIIRKCDKLIKRNSLIVIDAIRNPLEAMFFQDRYSSFYLIAVNSPDEQRKKRLRALRLHNDDIQRIDEQEYKEKDVADSDAYSIQDISSCLQRADIYINNPDGKYNVDKFSFLSNQVIKFIMLMRRPGLVTPNAIERCMQLAYSAKLNSGCISRQVGAAVTDSNFSIRAIGWNDVPHGQVPCNLRNRFHLVNGIDSKAYSDFEKNNIEFINYIASGNERHRNIQKDRNISYCFKSEFNKLKNEKNQVHTRALHAEENAFLQISKYGGVGICGGYLFTTASPCELCSKKAYQLGISRIYYIDPYPGIAVNHILRGGLNNPEMHLFSGAIGKAFHRLYMPIAPYKDELSALIKSD